MFLPDFSKDPSGLIPAIAQDAATNEILMQAYMNRDAWEKTLATGIATYWSRSRRELWVKGATSGHLQYVRQILVDCDQDCVVLKVDAVGGKACHKGYRSCFYREVKLKTGEIAPLDPETTSSGVTKSK